MQIRRRSQCLYGAWLVPYLPLGWGFNQWWVWFMCRGVVSILGWGFPFLGWGLCQLGRGLCERGFCHLWAWPHFGRALPLGAWLLILILEAPPPYFGAWLL